MSRGRFPSSNNAACEVRSVLSRRTCRYFPARISRTSRRLPHLIAIPGRPLQRAPNAANPWSFGCDLFPQRICFVRLREEREGEEEDSVPCLAGESAAWAIEPPPQYRCIFYPARELYSVGVLFISLDVRQLAHLPHRIVHFSYVAATLSLGLLVSIHHQA